MIPFHEMLWLTVTLGCFAGLRWLIPTQWVRWAHPGVLTMALLMFLIKICGIPLDQYESGGKWISIFLGPAVVALGVPLATHWKQLGSLRWKVCIVSAALSLVGVLSGVMLARWMGASHETLLAVAPKSVTSPIAIPILQKISGPYELAAVLIFFVGVYGALISEPVFRVFKIHTEDAQGYVLGAASHGIGTAVAYEKSDRCGVLATTGLCMMGFFTSLWIPILIKFGAI